MVEEITSVEQIAGLAAEGYTDWRAFGDVNVSAYDRFLLFNYSRAAVYAGRWNYFERVSRGLVIDRVEGRIAARGFDKFFNWGEGGRMTDAPLMGVTEKMDGSLGILLRDGRKLRVITRGSFTSEQGQWATEFLNTHYSLGNLHPDLTLLFEIVYPENRVVVDYGKTAALYLLAARDHTTGRYLPWGGVQSLAAHYRFPLPARYTFSSPTEIAEACDQLSQNQEGFVGEFADGSRYKFKGSNYLALARALSGLTKARVLEAAIAGTLEALKAGLPEEQRGTVEQWQAEIERHVDGLTAAVEAAYTAAPITSRKAFAQYVAEVCPDYRRLLFLRYDGRDLRPAILAQMGEGQWIRS